MLAYGSTVEIEASVATAPSPWGDPAFVQSAVLTTNLVGVLQVNFIVPRSAVSGTQPVVVTLGKFSSPPVNLVVQ